MIRVALVLLLAGCPKSENAPPPPVETPSDAGIDGITSFTSFDPDSGLHLDDSPPVRTTPKRVKGPAVPIGIMLKSTPPGATVIVDGENLGETPKYWSGVADGNEHEFEFSKKNYALARYVFVPITSGTLHATLVHPSSDTPIDAGTTARRDAAIAPPPTVLSPDAARVPDAEPEVDAVDAGDPMPPEEPKSQ